MIDPGAPRYTTGQVARRLGVSSRYLRALIASGATRPTVPSRKQGSAARWSEQDVTRLANAIAQARALRSIAAALLSGAIRARPRAIAVGPRGTTGAVHASAHLLMRRVGAPVVIVPAA